MAETAAATKPTLTYFKLHAKGDSIRMMLHHKGIEFVDNSFGFEEWGALKASGKCPAGQVPIWEEQDGRVLSQQTAIMRHIGRQNGYYPQDDLTEAFNIDWAIETFSDLWTTGFYRLFLFPEAEHGEKHAKALVDFTKFNNLIEGKLTEVGANFFAGNRITIADFVIFSVYLSNVLNEAAEETTLRDQFAAALESTPKVREYIERMKAENASFLAVRGAFKG